MLLTWKIKRINQFYPAQAALATPNKFPIAPSLATLGPVLRLGVPALSRVQSFSPPLSQLQKSCSKVPQRNGATMECPSWHRFFYAERSPHKSSRPSDSCRSSSFLSHSPHPVVPKVTQPIPPLSHIQVQVPAAAACIGGGGVGAVSEAVMVSRAKSLLKLLPARCCAVHVS